MIKTIGLISLQPASRTKDTLLEVAVFCCLLFKRLFLFEVWEKSWDFNPEESYGNQILIMKKVYLLILIVQCSELLPCYPPGKLVEISNVI